MAEDRLDAVDFILNTLKEHERSLDRIIAQLGEVTDLLRNATLEFVGVIVQSHEPQTPPPDPPQPMTARPLENDDRKETERAGEREMEEPSPSAIRPQIEQFDDYEFSEEKELLIKILHNLAKLQYLSITDLCRIIGAPRNYLTGFMAALEACKIVSRKGTPTHKIYFLTRSGEQLYQELQEKAREVIKT